MEDVITICLNIKKLRFAIYTDEPQKATLSIKGEKAVKAKELKLPSQVELINKDQHIATLTDKKASLEIEVVIQKGVGYEPKEMRDKEKREIGEISLDVSYSPVKKVSFDVENMRVGERTDFDKLIIRVETDGTITPEDALIQATELLIEHFSVIMKDKDKLVKKKVVKKKVVKKTAKKTVKKTVKKKVVKKKDEKAKKRKKTT